MKELAREAGMSISYISQVERGEIDPSLSSLRKIASVLQVPLYLLLDDIEIRGESHPAKRSAAYPLLRGRQGTLPFLKPPAFPGIFPSDPSHSL